MPTLHDTHCPYRDVKKTRKKGFSGRLARLIGILLTASVALMGCIEEHVEITIQPSGACSVKRVYIFERLQAEEDLDMIAGMEEEASQEGKKGDGNKPAGETPEEKLKNRIRQVFEMSQRQNPQEVPTELKAIRILEKKIEVATIARYGTLTEFIHLARLTPETGYTHMRMEKQAPQKTALIFYREDEHARSYIESLYERLVRMQQTAKITLKLPGDVLTSLLPNKKGNTTWLQLVNGKDPNTTVRELIAQDRVTITFKPNGLQLTAAIDSANREAKPTREDAPKPLGSNLLVVKAGPGYFAEPVKLQTTQIIAFESASDGSSPPTRRPRSSIKEEAVIGIRLFTPLTRHFVFIEPVKIITVLDDRQRPLKIEHIEQQHNPEIGSMLMIEAHLGLPKNDATTIAKIRGEVIAVTCADWSEKRIRVPATLEDRTFSLAPVLDDVTLKFTKSKTDSNSNQVTIVLTGQGELGNLSFAMEAVGGGELMHDIMEDKIVKKQGEWIRTVSIYYSFYRNSGTAGPVDITLKYPSGLKKEKITFTLADIDLM